MILAPASSQIRFIRVDYLPIKSQLISNVMTMRKLFNQPLRPMWLKIHWMSIGPCISFVVRLVLMIKKVIRAVISTVFKEGEKNDE